MCINIVSCFGDGYTCALYLLDRPSLQRVHGPKCASPLGFAPPRHFVAKVGSFNTYNPDLNSSCLKSAETTLELTGVHGTKGCGRRQICKLAAWSHLCRQAAQRLLCTTSSSQRTSACCYFACRINRAQQSETLGTLGPWPPDHEALLSSANVCSCVPSTMQDSHFVQHSPL